MENTWLGLPKYFASWMFIVVFCILTAGAQTEPNEVPLVAQFWLGGNSPGLMTSATAEVDTTPNLTCSVRTVFGTVPVTIYRGKDGAVLGASADSAVEVPVGPLSCNDTGVYVCRATHNGVTKSFEMDISVLCPPRLITKDLPLEIDSPFYDGSVGSDLTIRLDIMSCPPPDWLSLTTLNTKDIVAFRSKDVDESGRKNATDRERYGFEFLPASPPYGTVEVSIKNLTYDDIGRIFTLVVGNGVEANLSYTFIIRQAPLMENNGEIVTKPGPPASSDLNFPVVALGAALGGLLLILLGGVAGLVLCRKCGGRTAGIEEAMDHSMEVKRRQSNGHQLTSDTVPVSSISAVFDYSSTGRPRNLTFHVKELQQRSLNPSPHLQQQHQQQRHQKQIQQQQRGRLEQSMEDEEENFNKDYQPQDRLSRTHGTSESVENPYYVPGVDLDRTALVSELFEARKASYEDDANVYSSVPRNLSIQIDSLEKRQQLQRLSEDPTEASTAVAQNQDVQGGGPAMNQSKDQNLDNEKGLEQSSKPQNGSSTVVDLYDYPRSPSDLMKEAEWTIASASSGTEPVISGKHRKLSVPQSDVSVYEL